MWDGETLYFFLPFISYYFSLSFSAFSHLPLSFPVLASPSILLLPTLFPPSFSCLVPSVQQKHHRSSGLVASLARPTQNDSLWGRKVELNNWHHFCRGGVGPGVSLLRTTWTPKGKSDLLGSGQGFQQQIASFGMCRGETLCTQHTVRRQCRA